MQTAGIQTACCWAFGMFLMQGEAETGRQQQIGSSHVTPAQEQPAQATGPWPGVPEGPTRLCQLSTELALS